MEALIAVKKYRLIQDVSDYNNNNNNYFTAIIQVIVY